MNKLLSLGMAALAASAVFVVPATAPAGAEGTVPECRPGDMRVRYRATDHAAGHTYGRIVLVNKSDHTCRTGGYGGLSYADTGLNGPVGAPSDREGTAYTRFNLQPGQKAFSRVSEVNAGVYDEDDCTPHDVDSFRVYIPNARRAKFAPHDTIGCLNSDIHLITHTAYRKRR